VPEVRRAGDASHPPLQPDLVTGVPPEDQERRAGGAHVRVVQTLEKGRLRPAQVVEVHVVDGVRERAQDAEGPHRLARGAVVDIPPLAPVVPVDRRHAVPIDRRPGGDRRGGGGRDRREDAHALGEVGPAPEDLGEHRRLALLHRKLEHRGLQSIDNYEHKLGQR
jgi:hypothetical protein